MSEYVNASYLTYNNQIVANSQWRSPSLHEVEVGIRCQDPYHIYRFCVWGCLYWAFVTYLT